MGTPLARSRSHRDLVGPSLRLVGSRLPLDYARETGANLITAAALDAARARTSVTEPHQSFDHQRLWADLLSPGEVQGKADLAVMWLEHLLLLSMLQQTSHAWSWGRYVVVHPAPLAERSTFSAMTLEELLAVGVHAAQTNAALRDRYLPA